MSIIIITCWGRRDHDRMVDGYTTTYAISSYHHWCCEFESRSGRGVQHYVIKFVSDLRQVAGFFRVLRFPPPINWPPRYNWNIVESGVKHHQTNNIITCKQLHMMNWFFSTWFSFPFQKMNTHMRFCVNVAATMVMYIIL
jgi:hypothetical protein